MEFPTYLRMLKSKIHRAVVTECDLDYVGSIAVDKKLMEAAQLVMNEKVDIYNINNGERFSTYVIEAPSGSGKIGLNGAAARLACKGDPIIICSYCSLPEEKARNYHPPVVLIGEANRIERIT